MRDRKYLCELCHKSFCDEDVVGFIPKYRQFSPIKAWKNLLPTLTSYMVDLDDEFHDCRFFICVKCCNKKLKTELV